MLLFTYKLEKYIRNKIFPIILLDPNNYSIKGSFRRRTPYITDIDVVNNVYPKINTENIYDEILALIKRVEEKQDIILYHITCGIDERFKITTGSDEELARIRELLNDADMKVFDSVLNMYQDREDKKLFYINEIIWEYYRLRWTPDEVKKNEKVLPGGLNVKFSEIVKNNNTILLQYFIKIYTYWVGADVVVNYMPVDLSQVYKGADDYQLKLSNYAQDFYFMLFPLRSYFYKIDNNISQEISNIIDKKFGLYKQLIVQINNYQTLYKTDHLNIDMAKSIVLNIIKSIKFLPKKFKSNTITEIQNVASHSTADEKIYKWSILLDVLMNELNDEVNMLSKKYFFTYLNKLPKELQKKYYFNWILVNKEKNQWIQKK